jgi:hypothetical protein
MMKTQSVRVETEHIYDPCSRFFMQDPCQLLIGTQFRHDRKMIGEAYTMIGSQTVIGLTNYVRLY